MNIFIMVDMEGISGINCSEQVSPGNPLYEEGRQMMVSDVTACVQGCLQAGANRIVVRDAHYRAQNFRWLDLPEQAEYIIGPIGNQRMPDLGNFDGVILLGYHAMAGTAEAILEHTWSSSGIQNLFLNGRKTGEIGLDAAIAGEYGKPVIMVSGDDKACAEAREFLPGVVTAEVKTGYSVFGGKMLSRAKSSALICDMAAKAVGKIAECKLCQVNHPVVLHVELTERSRLPSPVERPYVKLIDARTYEVEADSVEDALLRF
jgi:D-amino peptidase